MINTENALFALGDNAHGQCGINPKESILAVATHENKWQKIQLPNTKSFIRSVSLYLNKFFLFKCI